MLKKLLRSRTGFEKPESREEAIMQNILGASNVLEPSESNIEEILKSILYNTPYTKEAEFEIEKILLAIKNNGTYDGEGESRDMKILIAILNDLDYTEEAESRIEELFIEWLHQRSSIKVLEGIPPLTFTSLGQPLINYLIEGNTVQNGTPTPDSPIMPQGTGERTGNLFDESTIEVGGLDPNTGMEVTDRNRRRSGYIAVDSSTYYSVFRQLDETLTSNFWALGYDENKNVITDGPDSSRPGVILTMGASSSERSFKTTPTTKYIRWYVTANNSYSNMMLNSGSTALPYEPYGYKIPISSANTTTPVYLGEVETTRKIKKLVLTGEESFVEVGSGGIFRLTLDGYLRESADIPYCTHYEGEAPVENAQNVHNLHIAFLVSGSGNNYMYIRDGNYTGSASNFKTYLAQQYAAGTPVTVWYVLATEETAVVNEPLMRIGDYADTISKEQAGVQIPTNNGTTVIDVDTTVKPSNIYIEYK